VSTAPAGGNPGDRPGIPLEGEPIAFFHALLAGAAFPVPGEGDGDGEPPLLEEEPALWLEAGRT
jgi:hypothetical protein